MTDKEKDIKKTVSDGVDKLLKDEKSMSDNDKYTLYVQSQLADGEISQDDADKSLKAIQDGKYDDKDDADAWVSSTVAGGENLYKTKEASTEKTASKQTSVFQEKDTSDPTKTRDDEVVKKSVDTKAMAAKLNISEDQIVDDLSMTELQKQENPYTKSDLTDEETVTEADNKRLDNVEDGKTKEVIPGVEVTGKKGSKVSVKSDYLGNFTYDTKQFALGYKEVKEKDGKTSQLPVLQYIGGDDGEAGFDFGGVSHGAMRSGISSISIPKGLKSMDYMFADNTKLEYMPEIPDSVTSAHYAFSGCTSLKCPQMVATSRISDKDYKRADENKPSVWNRLNGAGQQVDLPDGLQDMSGMFENCNDFEANFLKMPSQTRNTTNMFKGADKLGGEESHFFGLIHQDLTVPEVGGDKTPYLTSQYVKNMADTDNSKMKSAVDGKEYYVNADGTQNTKFQEDIASGVKSGKIDAKALNETQSQTGLEHQEDVATGKVANETEIATGGARTENSYVDSNGQKHYDASGEISSAKPQKNTTWQRVLIDGVTGLVGYGLTSKFTGSKLAGLAVGVGGTYLLDKNGILPRSLGSVLQKAAGILPDGKFKDTLNSWAEKLGTDDKTAEDSAKYFTKDRVAEEHAGARLIDSTNAGISDAKQTNQEYYGNWTKVNGGAAAESGAMWAAAREGENGESIMAVKDSIGEYMKNTEAEWAKQDDKTRKESMSKYYENLLSGLGEYNEGAKDEIKETYAGNETRQKLSEQGLQMTNRAYCEEVMDSMKRMEKQYGVELVSDEKLSELSKNIDGVGDLSKYNASKDKHFEDQKAATQDEVDSLVAVDELDYEKADYDAPEHAYKSTLEQSASNNKTEAENSDRTDGAYKDTRKNKQKSAEKSASSNVSSHEKKMAQLDASPISDIADTSESKESEKEAEA